MITVDQTKIVYCTQTYDRYRNIDASKHRCISNEFVDVTASSQDRYALPSVPNVLNRYDV